MKAALLTAPYEIALQEVDPPRITPDEVLIRIRFAGICGSDVHAYKGTHPFRKPPLVGGHELSGEIVEAGAAVRTLQPGDRVTVEPQTYCRACGPCLRGQYNLCSGKRLMGTPAWPGAFGEYVAVPQDKVYRLPDGLSLEDGALVEPLAVGAHAARMADVKLGDTVLVMGSGTIGLAVMAALRAGGATKVIASDRVPFNLAKAREIGVRAAVNVATDDLGETVKSLTGGEGVDTVVVAVGVPPLVDQALQLVRKRGRVVLLALFDGPATFDTFQVVFREVNMVGSWVYDRRDFETTIELLAQGRIQGGSFITHRWPIERVRDALETVDKKSEDVVKIVLNF